MNTNLYHLLCQISKLEEIPSGFIVAGLGHEVTLASLPCHDLSSTQRICKEDPRGYIFTAMSIVTPASVAFSGLLTWLETPGMEAIEWDESGANSIRCANASNAVGARLAEAG